MSNEVVEIVGDQGAASEESQGGTPSAESVDIGAMQGATADDREELPEGHKEIEEEKDDDKKEEAEKGSPSGKAAEVGTKQAGSSGGDPNETGEKEGQGKEADENKAEQKDSGEQGERAGGDHEPGEGVGPGDEADSWAKGASGSGQWADEDPQKKSEEEDDQIPQYVTDFIEKYYTLAWSQGSNESAVPKKDRELVREFLVPDVDGQEKDKVNRWYRVEVEGGVKIANKATEKYEDEHKGQCFHACKSEVGLGGIVKEGQVKAIPWAEDDPMSGSGDHGFYANAIHNGDIEQNMYDSEDWAEKKMYKILTWCMGHHHNTGVVVELNYRAVKEVAQSATEELAKIRAGYCTRLKEGKTERWCFRPEDTEITAFWIGPNREVMDKVIAHTKKETKMASGMPAWMSKIAKTNSRSNRKRPAEGGEGTDDKDEQASEKSQKIKEVDCLCFVIICILEKVCAERVKLISTCVFSRVPFFDMVAEVLAEFCFTFFL